MKQRIKYLRSQQYSISFLWLSYAISPPFAQIPRKVSMYTELLLSGGIQTVLPYLGSTQIYCNIMEDIVKYWYINFIKK